MNGGGQKTLFIVLTVFGNETMWTLVTPKSVLRLSAARVRHIFGWRYIQSVNDVCLSLLTLDGLIRRTRCSPAA
jgi:hypothetical protein